MAFPRPIIFEACNFLGSTIGYHGEFEDLVLRWELDELDARNGQAIHQRFRNLFRFLRDNPEARYDERLLTDLVVEEAARRVPRYHQDQGETFVRALERAGYLIEDGQLRRTLPEALDLPTADDEVHLLLNQYNLTTRSAISTKPLPLMAAPIGPRPTAKAGVSSSPCWTRPPIGSCRTRHEARPRARLAARRWRTCNRHSSAWT